ncbi:hypothetical protein [Nocardia suismassiliense]|uniref:hypothetical protein n=1 Tax=Nocardia suismassiliense TaxID=2077092 RepID=UPI000D1F9386|nr:hypothetical protein [Nocardia suismassiliense]
MNGLSWLPWRGQLESAEFAKVEAILREARRADVETMTRIAEELRAETERPRQQAEIDGVIARYRATHPESSIRLGRAAEPISEDRNEEKEGD